MKNNNYIIGMIVLNLIMLTESYAQVIDTTPPKISLPQDSLFSNFQFTGYEDDTSIYFELSCFTNFPTDYLKIPSPIITDDIDPAPQVEVFTRIDSINWSVTRTWIAHDASGNYSHYEIHILTSQGQGTPTIYEVAINDKYVNDDNKKDTIFFCPYTRLELRLSFVNVCPREVPIFTWEINNKHAYSKYADPLFLSLDTLPDTVNVSIKEGGGMSFTILQFPKPNFDIINPTCNGSSDGLISVTGLQSIKWENNSTEFSRQGLAPGKYWYTYSNDSCSRTDTIVLKPDKDLKFTISSNSIDLSQQYYITISNTSSLAGPYNWQIGDSVFSNNKNEFNFFPSKAGNYPIILSVEGFDCTEFTKTLTVTGTLPEVKWTSTNPTCKGSEDGYIEVSGTIPILWENQSDSKFRQNLDFGKYWYSYTDSKGFHTDTVKLIQENHLDFSLSDDHIELSEKRKIDITNTSTLEGAYQWVIGDSAFINNETEFEFPVNKRGNLDFTLSLANSNCLDEVKKTISVTGAFPTALPTDNTDKIEISPVPVNDMLQLYISRDGIYSARIFDLKGTEVYQTSRITSGKSIIPVGKLSAGTYIIKVFKETKMVYDQKFIKLD